MLFDARAAKILAPGKHLTMEGSPGLRLEATESRKTWTYRYRSLVDEKVRQIAIGQWPATSPAAATVAWESLRAVRDSGRDPALEKRALKVVVRPVATDSVYRVGALCEDYCTGHVDRHRKPKGAAEVRRTFKTMLGRAADREAATFTRSEAFTLLDKYQDIPVQASKLRLELGAAWDYALDAGKIPENTPNHWRQIMRGRLRSKGKSIAGQREGVKKRVLNEKEISYVLRWLPNFSQRPETVLTVYFWTGTRGAEIVAMEAEEISEEADGLWWTIPKEKTKNARHPTATDHRVPLVGRAETTVRRLLAIHPSGYLFPSGDSHLQQESVGNAVRYCMPYCSIRKEHFRPRLTVTRWSPHDVRRSMRTLLASMGCPVEVAEAILGHVPPGVQGVYNRHQYDRERREWLTKMSTKLEELHAAV